ncbi:uncharacterized protein RSE6_12936 [Rhynchosporium secalis]|uniref:Pentatricopeptide repeat protein n=1 Tax=Rhynchosporium secalis TaxID=38038 RepID=A0A1E1MRQ6_RHYSE|nr:uncharacterized protein RSE6_12936 [Rhynchosporium secalis]
MSSPHICLACRLTASKLRLAKSLQWSSRANFVSLSNNTRKAVDREPESGQSNTEEGSKVDYDDRSPRYPRRRPSRARPSNPGDVLESLFEKTINPSAPKIEEQTEVQSALEPYQNVQELMRMMENKAPYPDQWAYFLEHFGPDAQRAGARNRISMPTYLRPTVHLMWKAIADAKEHDHPLPDSLPSATEISKVFMELGYLHANYWIGMVSPLLRTLLKTKNSDVADAETEERLIVDLTGAWNIACRDIGQLRSFHDMHSSSYWMTLPSISMVDAVHVHQKRGSNKVFGLLVPQFEMVNLDDIPIIALATFGLLAERSETIESMNVNVSPLMTVLSRIISVPGLNYNDIYSSMSLSNNAELSQYVKDNWSSIRERAATMSQFHNPQVDKTKSERISRASVQMSVMYINRRLHEALKKRNLSQVDGIWSDVSQWPVDTSGDERPSNEQGRLTLPIANYLILIYMSLRQPNRAIDVWNHMISNGLNPTLRTWDSMMAGCVSTRDVKALQQVWARMINSKVEPDVICWATRVGGLIACRQNDAGVAALDEMGRKWMDAAKSKHPKMAQSELQLMTDVFGPAKPSIEVINAAIAGLFRNNMASAAYKILAWGGKFGIAPNIDTYNILLRSLIRDNRPKEAMALLHRMQKTGVQPDSYTFTAILDETFRSMEGLTPDETGAIVKEVFSEMEAAGVRPTIQIYGKIIRQLLPDNGEPGDMATVNAVMQTMDQQGIDANAQIYTLLLGQHFAQKPTNMDAVRTTIERASSTQGGTDDMFWDRAIEGYASNHETGPAMRILGKVQASKGRVGWTAMRMLLLALVENQEWELAKTLVNNAIEDHGAPVPVADQGYERQLSWEFWRMARNFGLVEQGPELKAQYLKHKSDQA